MSTKLRLATGNAGGKSMATLSDDLKPLVEIPSCPAFLMPQAKKEWKRITPILAEYGLISKLDRQALAHYCFNCGIFEQNHISLNEQIQIAGRKREAARVAHDAKCAEAGEQTPFEWTGGNGTVIVTTNGNFIYSPFWVACTKAARDCGQYIDSFALAPDARRRVTPSDMYPFLPGLEPEGSAPAKPTLASFSR